MIEIFACFIIYKGVEGLMMDGWIDDDGLKD